MPTIGTMPSLEATQAVGALLLHQFARERFSEAGVDERLIGEAEDQVHLDELAATVLQHEESDLVSTSLAGDASVRNSSFQTNGSARQDCSLLSNGHNVSTLSSNAPQAEERYHSMSDSVADGTSAQDRTVYHSINDACNRSASAFDRLQALPDLATYGRELRRIAEEFEKSRLRKTVKDRAGQVNLSDITKQSFVKLLAELFQEKITREKIVILFFFCTDVALRAAASCARDLTVKLMSWSFSYIINTVCSFIHRLGGWDKVLSYQIPSVLITCCAVLAVCSLVLYFKKSLRD